MNVKSHILPNRVFWRLDLTTGLSREFNPRANGLASLGLLSCSEQLALASASGILGTCASIWWLAAASHPRDLVANPYFFAQT